MDLISSEQTMFIIYAVLVWFNQTRRHPGGYVFTDGYGNSLSNTTLSRAFDALVAASKVKKIRIHDLRHTVASLMVMQGEEIGVVSLLLGHASVSITQATYRHVMPGETERAVDKFQEYLDNIRTNRIANQ